MKLYITYWKIEDAEDDTNTREHCAWSTSQSEASKAATAAKKLDGVIKNTVGFTTVEVDQRKEQLVEFLNAITNGDTTVSIAVRKLVG